MVNDPHATGSRAAFYDEACPECDGKVLIEDGVIWPEDEAADDEPRCEVCGGKLDA